MPKKLKLQNLYSKLSKSDTNLDGFKAFDDGVAKLKSDLEESIKTSTVDEVNSTLDKFKKQIDIEPLIKSVDVLKQNFSDEVGNLVSQLNSKLSELSQVNKDTQGQSDNRSTQLAQEIDDIRSEITDATNKASGSLESLRTNISKELSILKGELVGEVTTKGEITNKRIDALGTDFQQNKEVVSVRLGALSEDIPKLKTELLGKIAERGGGSMNRQIRVEGVDVLTRYTDINLYGVSSSIITSVDNVSKRVNIGIQGSGGGGGNSSIIVGTTSILSGADKRVLFDDNGVIGEDAGFTYNKSTSVLAVLGKVGVGTVTPGAKLDLATQDPNIFPLIARYDGSGGGIANKLVTYPFSDGNTYLQHDGKVIFAGVASITPQLTVDTTGFVGIGTNSPTNLLHITGTNNNGITIEGTYPALTLQDSASTTPAIYLNRGAQGSTIYQDTGNILELNGYNGIKFAQVGVTGVAFLTYTGGVKVAFGIGVTPTARLHIAAGTATAGEGQIKLDAGTLLGTTEAGSLENNGTHLYFTFANGGTRYQLDQQSGGSGITRVSSVISVSSTFGAVASTDYVVLPNVGVQVTLPTAIGNTNLYTVKNNAASSVLVSTSLGEKIDGSDTALLTTQYQSLSFISNNSVWGVI